MWWSTIWRPDTATWSSLHTSRLMRWSHWSWCQPLLVSAPLRLCYNTVTTPLSLSLSSNLDTWDWSLKTKTHRHQESFEISPIQNNQNQNEEYHLDFLVNHCTVCTLKCIDFSSVKQSHFSRELSWELHGIGKWEEVTPRIAILWLLLYSISQSGFLSTGNDFFKTFFLKRIAISFPKFDSFKSSLHQYSCILKCNTDKILFSISPFTIRTDMENRFYIECEEQEKETTEEADNDLQYSTDWDWPIISSSLY